MACISTAMLSRAGLLLERRCLRGHCIKCPACSQSFLASWRLWHLYFLACLWVSQGFKPSFDGAWAMLKLQHLVRALFPCRKGSILTNLAANGPQKCILAWWASWLREADVRLHASLAYHIMPAAWCAVWWLLRVWLLSAVWTIRPAVVALMGCACSVLLPQPPPLHNILNPAGAYVSPNLNSGFLAVSMRY